MVVAAGVDGGGGGEGGRGAARLVADHLEVLGVGLRRHRQPADALGDALDDRVVDARGHLAPALVARAHRGELVAREAALEGGRAELDEAVGLLLAQEVVKGHDPRVARESFGVVLLVLSLRPLEDGRDAAVLHGGGLVAPHARRVLVALRARVARERARGEHEARIGVALAAARPRRAAGIGVLALALLLRLRSLLARHPAGLLGCGRSLHGWLLWRRRLLTLGQHQLDDECHNHGSDAHHPQLCTSLSGLGGLGLLGLAHVRAGALLARSGRQPPPCASAAAFILIPVDLL